MDRAAFERLRDRLDAVLSPVKYRLAEERYLPGAFGTMYAVWSRRGESIRLTWDGKEGWLVLETNVSGETRDIWLGAATDATAALHAARDHVST